MTLLTLASGDTVLRIAAQGGAMVDATWRGRPILRPYPDAAEGAVAVGRCASFPLVPFGNRVAGNTFDFEGRTYAFEPNTDWDPHYLHGDGWQGLWDVAEASRAAAVLTFEHHGSVYAYRAEQRFMVRADGFEVTLAVANTGPNPMPFGLGHHPFLPLTPQTTLLAPANRYVTEKAGFLPDRIEPVPPRLDFSAPRAIPREWVNNGFSGWDGRAVITWPENGCALTIEAPASRYFLFHSDTAFEPDFRDDYFCFEPMTHGADAHHVLDFDGLVRLAPGDEFAFTTTFTVAPLPGAA